MMIEEQNKQIASVSINEVILAQLRDLKEGQHELRAEIKDVRQELKDVRQEIKEVRQELNGRIDRLASKIDSSSNHGQIATISTVGIALGVLYSIFFK